MQSPSGWQVLCMPVTFGCLCFLSQQNTVLKNMTSVLLKKQRRNWTLHRSRVRCLEHSDVLVLESFQRHSHEAVFRQDQARCRLSTEHHPRNTIHQASTRHPTAAARPRQLPSSPAERRLRAPFLQGLDGWSRNPNLGNTSYIRLYQAISGYIYRTSITSFWKKKPSNTEQRNVLRIAADRCVAVSCSLLRASADTDSSWQQLTAADIGSVGNRSQDITSCNAKDGRCGDVRIKDDLHIRTSFPQREYQYHWTSLNIIEYHGISRKSNMECCLWHLRSVNSQDFPTFQPPHGWI